MTQTVRPQTPRFCVNISSQDILLIKHWFIALIWNYLVCISLPSLERYTLDGHLKLVEENCRQQVTLLSLTKSGIPAQIVSILTLFILFLKWIYFSWSLPYTGKVKWILLTCEGLPCLSSLNDVVPGCRFETYRNWHFSFLRLT